MEVEVDIWAVVAATVVGMVVGSVWYARPVFGNVWIKLVKLDDKQIKEGSMRAMVWATVAGFLTAYVLAHVAALSHAFYNNSEIEAGLTTGFWLWLGISATTIITHHAFEQRPMQLTILAVGNQLVTLMAMGLVIGAFGGL